MCANMTKTCLAILLLFPLAVWADHISEADALQKAQTFLQQRGRSQMEPTAIRTAIKGRRAPAAHATASDYYVFNIGSNDGFVIVSGDDRVDAILGYADSGNLNEDALPDGLRYLLDGYAEQMAWLNEHETSTAAYSANSPQRAIRAAIAPLVKTHWNQGKPYNNSCPEIDGTRTVTGCVATTLAQLMYFHQWPVDAVAGIDSYSINTTNKEKKEITMTVPALLATTFKWEDMTQTYTSDAIGDAADAVAELMRYCGSALQMIYGLSSNVGSSSYSENIPYALKECFGYDGGVRHTYRKNYSYIEWVDLIYSELADGRPVALGGQSMGGGHSFVCDGYDGDDYFHINWGWGGKSDGYFRLSLLNPYEQGIGGSSTLDGFSFSQDAVIGIQPPVDGNKDYCLSLEGLRFGGTSNQAKSTMTFTRDSETESFTGISLYYLVYNYMQGSHAFDISMQMVDGSDNMVQEFYKAVTPTMIWNNHLSGTITSISIPSTVADGTYYIKVMSRPTGTTDWQECFDGDRYQLTAIINGDNLTINVPVPATVFPAAATIAVTTDSEAEGYLTQGYEQEVTASITGGAIDYHGNIILGVDDKAVMGKVVDIPAGQTADVHFTFIPDKAGPIKLSLYTGRNSETHNVSGTKIGSDKEVTITESDATNQIDLGFSATINNLISADSKQLYGNTFLATITATNPSTENSYSGKINCYVKKWTPGEPYTNEQGEQVTPWTWENIDLISHPLVISKGGSTTINIAANNLERDTYYTFRVTYLNTSYEGKVGNAIHFGHENDQLDPYTVTYGYRLGDANGGYTVHVPSTTIDAADAAFADLRDLEQLNNVTVTPSTNPNCLYLLAEGASVPDGLAGKNVVTGSSAATITIEDGKDFYSPIDFTATSISYTRTFTLAANGTSGWNSICLPFTVSSISCNNKPVDWYHSAEETNKNFWLRAFSADGEGGVIFDYAHEMAANTPYIIAVPDDRFGAEWQMTGYPVTFNGSNAQIAATKTASVSGNSFKFCGNSVSTSLTDAYVLNGSSFVKLKKTTTVPAFRAWFKAISISSLSRASLAIVSPEASGINTVESVNCNNDLWYTLSGLRLDTKPTVKGVYIHHDKKVIIK